MKIEAKLDNSPLHNNLIISKTDIFFLVRNTKIPKPDNKIKNQLI